MTDLINSMFVFRDWSHDESPKKLGDLHVRRAGTGERFEFAFDAMALNDRDLAGIELDPELALFAGRQYPAAHRRTFGIFADASPDRWGRTLIKRRFERDKRAGILPHTARLGEAQYLLGVHDLFRSGAIRFKAGPDGEFLDDRGARAAPPFVRLRELEEVSRLIESDTNNEALDGDAWLRVLLAPGASLGGARPKATVADPSGNLYIAKFPSIADDHDVGAWEYVVQRLALQCGLRTSTVDARRFGNAHHTFLTRRFDRSASGTRIHFASAMTLTGHDDGDDASSGASYLEIARVIMTHGAQADIDLRELWSRIVFNILVSNTDDHLRNHGFLLDRAGWRLSPTYDMNPVPHSVGLALNIDEADNALDLELPLSTARYYRVGDGETNELVSKMKSVVRNWRTVAESVGISRAQCESMKNAFDVAAR